MAAATETLNPATVRIGRRATRLLAGAGWLATAATAVATIGVVLATDFLEVVGAQNGPGLSEGDRLVTQAAITALCSITVAYATVGALLIGRRESRRIGVLLLVGGLCFGLVPFGYGVGGYLSARDPNSGLFAAMLQLGPVAVGPGYSMVLPVLAIAFPDGSLPSRRWRLPTLAVAITLAYETIIQIIRPGSIAAPGGTRNPFGIDALPGPLIAVADVALALGILAVSALGVASVIVRYRRGDPVERQQQRWFLAAVLLAAVPLALSAVPGIGGPAMALVATVGLGLVPISVGIAVTRYRLYEIDHLINRTLVYVPLTALLAGLYAATVTLLQRVFQSVTGDRSDAAVIISTLILASVFTPIRKWLEGIVDRRFKPHAAAAEAGDTAEDGAAWEARVAAVAVKVVRAELDARAATGSRRAEP